MKKLYLSIIVTVISALFIIGWALDKVFEATTTPGESPELAVYRQLSGGIAAQISLLNNKEIAPQLRALSEQFSLNLTVVDTQSVALPGHLLTQLSLEKSLILASEQSSYLLHTIDNKPSLLLQIDVPMAQADRDSSRLNMVLTVALYAGLCCILILWLIPLTRRLSRLTAAASKFGSGNLTMRVETSNLSYISTLENSFNRMANQIEELIAENKLLADGLSHDLRTPLACLRFGIDAALDEEDLDKKNGYITRLEEELTRMEAMLTAFLNYASIERQGINLDFAQFDINELLNGLVTECTPLANKDDKTLSFQPSTQPLLVTADHHWVYRALLNLLTNAIRFAHSEIIIETLERERTIDIIVCDDGNGIPEDKRQQIFKPFTKLDKARARESGNFGLGLAIVARIADWHQTQVNVIENTRLTGAAFSFTLPK